MVAKDGLDGYIHGLVSKDGLSEYIHGLIDKDGLDEYMFIECLLKMDWINLWFGC